MSDERRAGIILFDRTMSRILLVQSKRTGKWGFTKGHAEMCDVSMLETAVREVEEESGYVEGVDYNLISPIHLRDRPYWTAVLHSDELPKLNNNEHEKDHSGIGWFTMRQIGYLKLNKDVTLWLQLRR
jgi:8-oxo-dGTP pyrophosphatase MutT (NUDIX family)